MRQGLADTGSLLFPQFFPAQYLGGLGKILNGAVERHAFDDDLVDFVLAIVFVTVLCGSSSSIATEG